MSLRPVLRLEVGGELKMTDATAGMASRAGVPLVLTTRALRMLAAELGGIESAARWFMDLTTATAKPIACNIEADDGSSQTVLLPPRGWGEERTLGYTAGLREELGEMFGPVERVYPLNRAGRRRQERRR
jgi:hypothetical protein